MNDKTFLGIPIQPYQEKILEQLLSPDNSEKVILHLRRGGKESMNNAIIKAALGNTTGITIFDEASEIPEDTWNTR